MQLQGKNIVITASTDGIGFATAHKFLEEGAHVLINGRNKEKAEKKKNLLEKTFGNGKVFLFVGDTTVDENLRNLRRYAGTVFDHIDCIISNVGSGKPIVQDELDMRGWEKSFDINLFSTIKLIKVFDDFWAEKAGGSIVLMSSLAAYSRISAPYSYAAAKHGICVLAKYLSDDYAPRKIRVNSVIPGNVFYEGGRWEELFSKDEAGVKDYIEHAVPLKRFATPNEIANIIVFLSSGCASFITGAALLVDGGQNRGMI